LKVGSCLALGPGPDDLTSSPDGLAYVAAGRELWVIQGAPPLGVLPADRSIVVLDASNPARLERKTTVPLEGAAEGYAVDEVHGLFYTNLAEGNETVAIDVRTHRAGATWRAGCDEDGPRGIAVDQKRRLVFVACTDQVVVLDAAKEGARVFSLPSGAGVDNIDYVEARRELFVAAGKREP
jgi:DNA-binding beta-propeller fold protein YncE